MYTFLSPDVYATSSSSSHLPLDLHFQFFARASATGIGLICCVLRILFCICPSHCITSGRRKLNEKNAKVGGVDHTTSLLKADSKRVSISKACANEVSSCFPNYITYNIPYICLCRIRRVRETLANSSSTMQMRELTRCDKLRRRHCICTTNSTNRYGTFLSSKSRTNQPVTQSEEDSLESMIHLLCNRSIINSFIQMAHSKCNRLAAPPTLASKSTMRTA